MKVKGYINLNNCNSLTSLGKLKSVGWHLNLDNCTSLTSLGDLEIVGGYIYGASDFIKEKYKGKFDFKN